MGVPVGVGVADGVGVTDGVGVPVGVGVAVELLKRMMSLGERELALIEIV